MPGQPDDTTPHSGLPPWPAIPRPDGDDEASEEALQWEQVKAALAIEDDDGPPDQCE